MIRTPIIALLVLPALFLSRPAFSHSASTIRATATATVVEDLRITSRQPLDFGFVMPSPKGGTVTISPENRRSETGGVRVLPPFSRAVFRVRGLPDHGYTIHTPSTLTFTARKLYEPHDGKNKIPPSKCELSVTNFVAYSKTAGSIGGTASLNRDGRDEIYVGATLVVPPDAAPGVYSGFVPLTVSY